MSNTNNPTTGNNEQLTSWNVDPTHTNLQFSVRHMVISEVTGDFNSYSLQLKQNAQDFSDVDIQLIIDTNSISTGNTDRDNHLKSADFFDVEKFPSIKFNNKSMKKIDDENYKLTGELTIKDITKEIELDVNYGGEIVDPWGNLRAGFKITGKLNRFDYGLNWNSLMETGGAIVSKNINIVCNVEIVRQK